MIYSHKIPIVKLGSISKKIDYGLTTSAKDSDGKPKFLRITDIQDNSVDWDNVPSCECTEKDYEKYALHKGDIVFARTGATTGKSFLIRECPQAVFASYLIRVSPSSKINSEYLSWFFQTPDYWRQITFSSTGTAQPGVNSTKLKELQIPLPPLEEQKRIAAILDKADRVRRKRQETIRLTEELGRSIFLDMFGDPVTNPKGLETKPLGNIATFLGGGTPARNKDEYFQGEICWASSKDMGNEILVDTQEHITQEAIDNSSTKLVPSGTLLVVVKSKILMRRLPVSRTAIDTCFNQDIKAIVPKDLSLTRYLQVHLKLGQETLLRQARGVNTEGLTLEHLRKYPVLMPKQENITKFTNTSKELEKMLLRNRKSFQETENLFNSLLQRAFRGEL